MCGGLCFVFHLLWRGETGANRQRIPKFPCPLPLDTVTHIDGAGCPRKGIRGKDLDPPILPPCCPGLPVVLPVLGIRNQGTLPPQPAQGGDQVKIAFPGARRSKERTVRVPIITVDHRPHLPHDDSMPRREACACHLAWGGPACGAMGREVKGPPTPEEIGHEHHRHARTDDGQHERRMVLCPVAQVFKNVKRGHAGLLLAKSRSHQLGARGWDTSTGVSSTTAGGSGRNSSYICAYRAMGRAGSACCASRRSTMVVRRGTRAVTPCSRSSCLAAISRKRSSMTRARSSPSLGWRKASRAASTTSLCVVCLSWQ